MDTLLIDQWLRGADAIEMRDEASVSLVRERVRERAAALSLDERVTGALVNVASELAHNQLAHASRGEIAILDVRRDDVAGLEIIAADRGDGIANPSTAVAGHVRKAGSLGVGLAAVLELADEVDIDVRIGEGTCIWARKFAEPIAKAREVGIFARPHPGERTLGDHACFVRDGNTLLVAVVDGVGHGEPARAAANAAIYVVQQGANAELETIVRDVNEALVSTRGAVMSVARFGDHDNATVASIGNVAVHVHGPQASRRVAGVSSVLGGRAPLRKVPIEELSIGNWDALIAFTDGLTTQTDVTDLAVLREHPIVIAHHLIERFGRGNDDAMVLVAR